MRLLVAHAVVVACASRHSRDVSPDQQPHQIRSASSRLASGGRRGRPPIPSMLSSSISKDEKKFQIPLHSINTWQTPLLACALKVLEEGAESGEGEPIHYFTKRGVFGIDGQLRKPLPSPALTILVWAIPCQGHPPVLYQGWRAKRVSGNGSNRKAAVFNH